MLRTRRIAHACALLGAAAACLASAAPAAAQTPPCPSQANRAYDSGGSPAAGFPNDPLFPRQWGLDQIRAGGAWGLGAFGGGAVVAVVDTGVDLGHPDLAGQLLPGHDLSDQQCAPGPQDENGHGTHVAGIVAAIANNGIGVAGTAPAAKLLPVRVLDSDAGSSTETMTKGVRWAADNGADVINLSIGENLPDAALENEQWTAAVQYAWSRGAVVVVAAGNDPIPVCEAPSNSPNVICVAATDSDGFPSWYSSFPNSPNEGVQVRAPGGRGALFCDDDIWSTYWPNGEGDEICDIDGYEPFAGTSMAAPHVSGLAAMLAGGGLTNAQILECIRRTSSNAGEYDPVYGYGIVDAQAAATGCGANFTQASGGGPPPSPAGAQPASDRTAPRVRLALRRTTRARVVRRGRLPLRIRASEPATVAIRAMGGRVTAAAGRKATVIARGTVRVTRAGTKLASVRLTRAGRRMLRVRRARTITLLGRARDAAGNAGTAASWARLR